MKNQNRNLIIASIVCFIPIIAGLVLWNELPEQIPTHFGFNGDANQYSSKLLGVLGIPVFIFLINLLVIFITKKDPNNKDKNQKILNFLPWVIAIIANVAQITILVNAMDYKLNMIYVIWPLLGIFFAIFGNYMPKISQNYTIGIKLPWTLKNKDNWRKTHRLTGYVWVIGGVLITLSTFFIPFVSDEVNLIILLVIIFLMILIPTFYSYNDYKKNHVK